MKGAAITLTWYRKISVCITDRGVAKWTLWRVDLDNTDAYLW